MPEPAIDVTVGCDVQDAAEVRQAIESFGRRYLSRILGVDELAAAREQRTADRLVRHVAGRFAAKEAVFKLLCIAPDTPMPWPEIQIVPDAGGTPHAHLSGTAAKRAAELGLQPISVSISHSDEAAFAVAVAIALPRVAQDSEPRKAR